MNELEKAREAIAQKLYELAGYNELVIESFPLKAWVNISSKAKERWRNKADQILNRPELAVLAEHQELPENKYWELYRLGPSDHARLLYRLKVNETISKMALGLKANAYADGQADMIKAGWKKCVPKE